MAEIKNVVKRNGQIVKFDQTKILNAITKANNSVPESERLDESKISEITSTVVDECAKSTENIGVEDIQDMVETGIMKAGAFEVAKHYITYRYQHSQIRQKNTTDDKILSLVGLNNKEAKSENSNKNPVINSTQRDYMAGEISRDLTRRYLLPQIVLDAWNEGAIHFHDSDYFAQHSFNCFSGGTRFITDTGIREFRSFKDGEQVYVKDYLGVTRLATVHTYGMQKFNKVTLRTPQMRRSIKVTADHRWLLSDGTITTNLKVGDTLAPTIGNFGFTIDNIEEAKAFCIGFIIGDGTDRHHQFEKCTVNSTFIRLCGDKVKYANIFTTAGYRLSSVKGSNDLYTTVTYFALKQDFLNGHAWRYMNPKMKELVFKGYYAADGAIKQNRIATSDPRICEMIEEISGIAGYYISSKQTVVHDTNFKAGATLYYYHFITYSGKNCKWVVESIEPSDTGIAYCVNEPVTHTFTLEAGIVTGNCSLINLDDMLKNGTVITGTLIETPHSFSTACNITTQIIAQVASNQYGGQSISLTHLAPFVDVSRKKIRAEVIKEHKDLGIIISPEEIEKITEMRLRIEVQKGVQTIQYQVVTLLTTNGQAPFITVFLYLNEARNEQEKKDLAMIIEETLRQRYQGVKNECGVYVTPAFPKLVYVLEEDNITEDSPYWYLTELAAKCTSKRMVPDYLSEKKMLQVKGDVYPPMGCRSFLTPDRFTDNGTGNIANAGNYEPGKHKYYGRFNQGVVTINLPYIAMLSHRDPDKFWEIFDKYLDICHTALRCRHERLLGTPSDVAPILWQFGAIARLKKGEVIDKLLYGGYSTISLGYAGLYECTLYMTGKSHTDPEGEPFAIQVMQHMNDKTAEWKAAENIDYSLYGTPMESTIQTFAKVLKKFEIVPGVNDHGYISNSYHVNVREHIDAFEKLHFESKFQEMSPGGCLSYIECPDMKDNIEAVLQVLKYIYETTIYAELNIKSDYCQCCGFDGQIEIVKDDKGEFIWKCPNCGNTDQNKMNVARRTCGLNY